MIWREHAYNITIYENGAWLNGDRVNVVVSFTIFHFSIR